MKYKLSYGAIPRDIRKYGYLDLLKKCMNECMIKMGFVTYEIGEKLKEKGYPMAEIPTGGIDNRNIPVLYDLPKEHPNWQDCKAWWVPTISQVLKWLREEKKVHIIIPASFDEGYWWEVRDFNREISEYSVVEYTSYEESAIAGIEYILDNLI
jgi:hypothetical protein